MLSFEVLGFVAADDGAAKARESILDILETGDVHERALAVRAAAASGHPGMAPAVGSVMDGDAAHVRRSAAPWLWRFDGDVGRSLIQRALEDDDPVVRALAVLSLGRSDWSDGASKAERLLDLMADPDEIVRLNAAAELSTLGEDILPLTERVCQAYDRSLSTVEALQALHLLAISGAPCLEDRAGRLIFQDGAGRGAVIDATRIGIESGSVSLDEDLRMGIESCAAGGASLQADACMDILEGGGPGSYGCAGPGPFAVPAAAIPVVAVPPSTLAPDLGRGCVLPGLYQVTSAKSFPDGHPIFVVDGTLVIRMTAVESGLGVGLPAPACGDYASAGILDL